MSQIIFRIFFLTLFLLAPSSYAQLGEYEDEELSTKQTENESSEQSSAEEIDENFTGTLAPEEDPDHPDYEKLQKEKEMFGEEKEKDEELLEGLPNYLLKFSFEGHVIFYDKTTGSPYLEIVYLTTLEQEILLVNKRYRVQGKANFDTDIVGDYAGNDLFTCKLEINIQSYDVEIMARERAVPDPDDKEILNHQVALQLKFQKDYQEEWYSNCTSIDGSLFNTKGNPEKYNIMILEEAIPSLNAMLVEEFSPGDDAEISVETELLEIEDPDLDLFTISGRGTVTLEAF